MLSSKRFATVQRLKSAASNNPPLKKGETGEAVRVLQLALLSLDFPMPISTKNYTSLPDGVYGNETYHAVKAFQSRYALDQDGIAGRDTLGKLDGLFSASVTPNCSSCGNCHAGCGPYTPPHLIQAAFASSGSGSATAQLPSSIRPMTQAEQTKAESVFGNSLFFSTILISDGLGIGGRAFVSIIPFTGVPLPLVQGMGIGMGLILVNWGPSPSDGTIFHELTHVWQSQHHLARHAFMVNAVISQKVGELAGGSAYAFIKGRLFVRYGAEQIAQQVERGKSDIINHIAAFPPLFPDPTNLPVPGLPFWETPGAPGVET